MITIGTLKLDLVADREPFVHDLYGRWDTFNRTSLEGIVDEILSRYDTEDEDELLQGKFVAQRQTKNQTGIPDHVIQGMVSSFGTDFSSVRVHPDSSKAPEVGALAYTQGTDIHFAPGQFKPDTSAGQQLLGHELTHVIQQAKGRVQPTTEVGGMAVNDDLSLEHEADVMGAKAASVL